MKLQKDQVEGMLSLGGVRVGDTIVISKKTTCVVKEVAKEYITMKEIK